MLTAYKAICRPILNYAAPVWTPALSDTQWKELQTCQNSALRTATGCHLMSSIDPLHVVNSSSAAHRPDRPDNFVTKPPDRARTRPIRRTLKSKRGPSIEDLVPSGGLSWEGYRAGLKSIHQTGLTEVLQSYQPNIVLGGYPPPINTLERNLPRSTRCTLAQLRSGYSLLINSYKSKIDPDTVDSCPDCAASPHSTSHLFDCPSNPTQVSAESLWRDPIAAAKLLRLEMGDLGETHKPPHKVTIRWMKRDVAVAGSSQRNEREDNTLLVTVGTTSRRRNLSVHSSIGVVAPLVLSWIPLKQLPVCSQHRWLG